MMTTVYHEVTLASLRSQFGSRDVYDWYFWHEIMRDERTKALRDGGKRLRVVIESANPNDLDTDYRQLIPSMLIAQHADEVVIRVGTEERTVKSRFSHVKLKGE